MPLIEPLHPNDTDRALPGPVTEVTSSATSAACLLPPRDTIRYSDELLTSILHGTRTIAMVGASPNWNRPSYFAMRYLQRKGFRVIPVNPRALDAPILGEQVYPDLASVPVPVDVVDVFRRPSEVPAIAHEAVRIGAKVLWLQLGITSEEAREIAEAGGLTFIQDHCMKIEYGRLSGELSWSGINSGIITSKRRRILV
jgi:predicted CoA-binding protein